MQAHLQVGDSAASKNGMTATGGHGFPQGTYNHPPFSGIN